MISYLTLLERNYTSTLYRFRVIESYLLEVSDFNLPHLHLVPPLTVTPFEFSQDFWYQKTRVPELSCGVVCVILRLAILTHY